MINAPLSNTIERELKHVMEMHRQQLSEYMIITETQEPTVPDDIVASFKRLITICEHPTASVSRILLEEAHLCTTDAMFLTQLPAGRWWDACAVEP